MIGVACCHILYVCFSVQLFSQSVTEDLEKQKMEVPTYLTLYTPALDFVLQAVASGASDSLLSELLDRCQKHGSRSVLPTFLS